MELNSGDVYDPIHHSASDSTKASPLAQTTLPHHPAQQSTIKENPFGKNIRSVNLNKQQMSDLKEAKSETAEGDTLTRDSLEKSKSSPDMKNISTSSFMSQSSETKQQQQFQKNTDLSKSEASLPTMSSEQQGEIESTPLYHIPASQMSDQNEIYIFQPKSSTSSPSTIYTKQGTPTASSKIKEFPKEMASYDDDQDAQVRAPRFMDVGSNPAYATKTQQSNQPIRSIIKNEFSWFDLFQWKYPLQSFSFLSFGLVGLYALKQVDIVRLVLMGVCMTSLVMAVADFGWYLLQKTFLVPHATLSEENTNEAPIPSKLTAQEIQEARKESTPNVPFSPPATPNRTIKQQQLPLRTEGPTDFMYPSTLIYTTVIPKVNPLVHKFLTTQVEPQMSSFINSLMNIVTLRNVEDTLKWTVGLLTCAAFGSLNGLIALWIWLFSVGLTYGVFKRGIGKINELLGQERQMVNQRINEAKHYGNILFSFMHVPYAFEIQGEGNLIEEETIESRKDY